MGFTNVMTKYIANNIIQAIRYGIGVNESSVETIIKKHIDKGMPVTMYNAFGDVSNVSDHYCNIYGYVTYEITKKDSTEPPFEQTLLMVKLNYGKPTYYVDPAFLNSWCTGLIGYDVLYNTKQISMGLFSEYVDENNAQFVNTPVDKVIYINNLTPIETTGLRSSYKTSCGKEYLVLSSITESEDEEYIVYDPYIELNMEDYTDICAIDIKLLRLDSEDAFSTDDEIVIEGYNEKNFFWDTIKTISPSELETLDEIEDSYPNPSFIDAYDDIKNYRIYVDTYGIEKIRISLDAKYIDNNTNRRDIAVVSLDVHLDNENEPPYEHIHDYTRFYNYIDSPNENAHYAYCSCSEKILEMHKETIVDGSTVCELCGYVIEAHEHSYTLQQKDNNAHIYVCDCGRINEEAHTIEGSPVGHTTTICTICEDTIILNHIYGYHYDTTTETTHKTYCICGDFQTVSHEYTEIYYEDDSYHIEHCICGAYIVEEHDYTHNYLKNSSLNHKSYCACGDYILQSHAISPSDVGMNFANCMFCLCLLDLRNDFGEIEPTNISIDILTSDNGSYILPSGIIVLVDKDIIAYMNGTLVFRKDEDNEIM